MEKRVRILLISAIGVVFAIAATVAVLFLVFGRDEVEKLNPATATSADVVRVYAGESEDYWSEYEALDDSKVYAGLLLDSEGRTYEVPAESFLVYKGEGSRSFGSITAHSERLLSHISEFTVSVSQDARVLYQNASLYCQLHDTEGDSSEVVFACAPKAYVDEQVSLARQLNSLYAGEAEAVTFDFSGTVTLVDETEVNDAIRYATLSYDGVKSTTTEGYPRLLFGAKDGQWEFVANLNNQSVLGDGKRSVSEEDSVRINDEKWEGAFNDVF